MEPKLCQICFSVPVVVKQGYTYRFECLCGDERTVLMCGSKNRQSAIRAFNQKVRFKKASKELLSATKERRENEIQLRRERAAKKVADRLNFLAQQNPVGLLVVD